MGAKTYEEVMDCISSARRFGKQPGAAVMPSVLEQLGLTDLKIPYIHVAGTNGKGSVCAFLDSILSEAGYRVGLFTSPHLVDFEERIRVGGRMIAKEEVRRIGAALLEETFAVELTMFDYCLAMALLYFKEQQADVMVIETGLGGRLDSTNAIGIPEVCVITKLGFDHTAVLGDTIEEIAREKAGIIKRGCPVVTERQEEGAIGVLTETFQKVNASENDTTANLYMVTEGDISYTEKIELKLIGVHQRENAAAAMLAARIFLSRRGLLPVRGTGKSGAGGICAKDTQEISEVIVSGLKKAVWPGRMELLSKKPFFLVDGAHNGHGVAALCESLRTLYPGKKFVFFMAVMADKDYADMVALLLPLARRFYTYAPESGRAMQSERLAAFIREQGVEASACGSLEELFFHIAPDTGNVAFGSLYFIGDLKKNLSIFEKACIIKR